MKPLIIIFIFLIKLAFIHANDVARNHYLGQQYEAAISAFHKELQQSPTNPAILYNLGASYFQAGNYLSAKIYFLNALSIQPKDPDTRHNLRIVNQSFIDNQLMFSQYWTGIAGYRPIVLATLCLIIALILSLIYGMLFHKKNTSSLNSLMLFAVFTTTLLGIILMCIHYSSPKLGVITAKKTPIYSGPSRSLPTLFSVHEGAEFHIESADDHWSNIQFPNGLHGWIKTNAYQAIPSIDR